METSQEQRIELCKSLGFISLSQVHEFVVTTAKRHGNGALLLQHGLTAKKLEAFGYTAAALRIFGYDGDALSHVGFGSAKKPANANPAAELPGQPVARPSGGFKPLASTQTAQPAKGGKEPGATQAVRLSHQTQPAASPAKPAKAPAQPAAAARPAIALPAAPPPEPVKDDEIQRLLDGGQKAAQLRARGITAQRLGAMGLAAITLKELGFTLEELAQTASAEVLLDLAFPLREVRKYFNGHDLKLAGCTALQMRQAGFGVGDLIAFGYSDSAILNAGFSSAELTREGLALAGRT